MRSMRSLCRLIPLLFAVLLAASSLSMLGPVEGASGTLIVPDQYSTLTLAIDHAIEGDTIFVRKGTHEMSKNAIMINKTISIIGENQTDTIINFPPDTRVGFEFFATLTGFRVNAKNFQISNLTITNRDYGVYINGNGAQISKITTSSIYLNGNYCKISGNSLINSSSYQYPLKVRGSFNDLVDNNNFVIECVGSFNSLIGNSGRVTVEGNSNYLVKNTFDEITLSNANSNLIYNNSLKAFSLRGGDNNTVCGNNVKAPYYVWGILLATGSGNMFYSNEIANFNDVFFRDGSPYGYGVAIGADAKKNFFYNNNFINNYKHVSANWEISGAENFWDNGEAGNYWDDYTGTDIDGNGIGDIPYIVRGQKRSDATDGQVSFVFGQDNYPLMAPFKIDSVKIEPPEWTYRQTEPQENEGASPSLEPFSTMPVLAAVLISIVTGSSMLVYFIKLRKRRKVGTSDNT
jgi:nitrous oxidase accessory protein